MYLVRSVSLPPPKTQATLTRGHLGVESRITVQVQKTKLLISLIASPLSVAIEIEAAPSSPRQPGPCRSQDSKSSVAAHSFIHRSVRKKTVVARRSVAQSNQRYTLSSAPGRLFRVISSAKYGLSYFACK